MRKKLIEWEAENGYKAKFVAESIGVTESGWSNIKKGVQAPTFKQLQRFKDAFKVDDVLELFKEVS